ncbi:hypothetical protein [Bacillus smithii]|uniref:hypothetical protein n=1 Tax=Bacillus smithii TaxID=1479 RepID=UPI003D1EDE69
MKVKDIVLEELTCIILERIKWEIVREANRLMEGNALKIVLETNDKEEEEKIKEKIHKLKRYSDMNNFKISTLDIDDLKEAGLDFESDIRNIVYSSIEKVFKRN